MFRLALTLAALLLLASCVSLTEDQCRAGDWRAIGVEDGAEGRGPERLEAHRRACGRAGVVPDAAAWEAGRQEGLRLYCTPAKAYQVGRAGRSIAPGCTAAERAAMAPAYARGEDYYDVLLRIQDVESEIDDLDREIFSLAPDDPGRGILFARRSMLQGRIGLLRLELGRYDSWP